MYSKYLIHLALAISIITISLTGYFTEVKEIVSLGKAESAPEFNKERDKYFWERLKDPNTGLVPQNIRSLELEFVNQKFNTNNSKNTPNFLNDDIWQRRGPWEVGGRTRALGFDIRNEDILIAGSVSGGMWKSSDAGISWVKTSLPYQLHSVSCIAQDTRKGKENNWYYGTGEYWGNSAAISGDGLFKSTDNGSSWQEISSTVRKTPQAWDQPFDYCWNIVTNPTAPIEQDEVLVATASFGIMRSTDGGSTWTSVIGGQSRSAFSDIAVTSGGIFYATLSSDAQNNVKGIFRSTDGVKWINITPSNFPRNYRRVVIGISPSDESQIYFLGETPGYGKLTFNSAGDSLWHSLWYYKNYGGEGNTVLGDWEDRSNNLPKPEPTRGQMNSQMGYNLVIKVKPDNPNVVFVGAVAMYRSNSGFKNNDWAWIGGTCPDESCDYSFRYTNHHADVHTILFSKNNFDILYTGSDGGIHKTLDNMSDNVEWISLNNGYFTTQFYSIGIDHGSKLSREIIGGLQDNGTLLSKSTDMKSNEWTNPLRADGFCCRIPDDAPYYYASQNSTWQPKIKIYRIIQDENGKNTISTRIDPIGGLDFIWNTPFVLDPNNNNIMYLAGGKMLWRNNNLSAIPFENSNDSTSISWDSLSNTRIDFINTAPLGERITAVSVSKQPANIVYYGTSTGKVYRINNANEGDPKPLSLFKSPLPSGYVSSISIDPMNADEVIVSYSNYGIVSIFYSNDAGNNWQAISGNLEERQNGGGAGPGVNWISILPVGNRKVYFAGTTAGLFSTTFLNGDATAWALEGPESIGNMVIHEIDVRESDGYVAIGTHGTGVFEAFYKDLPEPPQAVNLLEPANNTINVTSIVNLKWEGSTEQGFYELEVARDPNFIDIFLNIKGIASTEYNIIDIEQGKKSYYWRVRNVGPGGLSEYSETWSFTSAIQAPKIVFPASGSDQVMTSFSFLWENVEFATSYRLQVAQGFNISNNFIDTVITENTFLVENFDKNKRYIWRLASIENDFQGEFGDTYHFITRHPASVNNQVELGLDIVISPNPVNQLATIKFNKQVSSDGQLQIIDIHGKPIKVIDIDHSYDKGFSYLIDLKELPIGNYFIVYSDLYQKFGSTLKVVR